MMGTNETNFHQNLLMHDRKVWSPLKAFANIQFIGLDKIVKNSAVKNDLVKRIPW